MNFWELTITALALSMDAFAVAICKGLSLSRVRGSHMVTTGAWFGSFQAIMPLFGFFLGSLFAGYIEAFDHWIAFLLLAFIGVNMIKESFSGDSCPADASFGFKTMLTMAIATSIDALAVGITFALLPGVNIAFAVISIGVITFVLSSIGVKVGSIFGAKYKSKAELVGGFVLCLMGVKILLEHLGVLAF